MKLSEDIAFEGMWRKWIPIGKLRKSHILGVVTGNDIILKAEREHFQKFTLNSVKWQPMYHNGAILLLSGMLC